MHIYSDLHTHTLLGPIPGDSVITDMKIALGDCDSWLDLETLLYITLPPSKEEWVRQPDYNKKKKKRVLQKRMEVSNNKYHGRVFKTGVHFVDSHL